MAKKGHPRGQPFHCRAVIRLNQREHTAFRRCGPPERQGSSSRMPAIAAIDNETLDHLLSVVDDARNVPRCRALSKQAHAKNLPTTGCLAATERFNERPSLREEDMPLGSRKDMVVAGLALLSFAP